MPRVTLTKTVPVGPVPLTALTVVTWTAADTVNFEQLVLTQKDILVIWNSDVASHTYTLTSVADTMGRTDTGAGLVNVALAAGAMHACIPGYEGFAQAGTPRYLFLQANHVGIKYAVLTFP